MSLKKTILIASIGVPAAHHLIRHLTLNFETKTSSVTVASFYDSKAAADGAQSIGMATITLETLPAIGEDPHAFCERELVAVPPAAKSEGARADLMANPNRYLFAGAEILA